MIDTYICQTPLHLIISKSIEEKRKTNKAQYIWLVAESINKDFFNAIAHNNKVLLDLPEKTNSTKIIRQAQKLINLGKIKKNKGIKNTDEFFIFNDQTPETQKIINIAISSGKKVNLAEDGVAIYETGGDITFSKLNKYVGKIIYGCWWEPNKKIGESRNIKKIYATYPEMLRKEVSKEKELEEIHFTKTNEIDCFLKKINENLTGKTLIALPLSSKENISQIEELINSTDKEETFIKLHPREPKESKLRSIIEKHKTLPSNLPIEIFAMADSYPDVFIGFESSSTHIIRKINPKIKTYHYTYNSQKKEWKDFYKQINIPGFSKENK